MLTSCACHTRCMKCSRKEPGPECHFPSQNHALSSQYFRGRYRSQDRWAFGTRRASRQKQSQSVQCLLQADSYSGQSGHTHTQFQHENAKTSSVLQCNHAIIVSPPMAFYENNYGYGNPGVGGVLQRSQAAGSTGTAARGLRMAARNIQGEVATACKYH